MCYLHWLKSNMIWKISFKFKFQVLNRDRLDHLDSLFGASGYPVCRHGSSIRGDRSEQGGLWWTVTGLFLERPFKTFFIPFPPSQSLYPAELQAAICIHRDPAPTSEHGEGFLEAGPGLSLHIHRDAKRRWPSPGKPDLIRQHEPSRCTNTWLMLQVLSNTVVAYTHTLTHRVLDSIASLKVADWEVLPMITCAGGTGLRKRVSRTLSLRLCHNTRGSKPEVRPLSPSKSLFP